MLGADPAHTFHKEIKDMVHKFIVKDMDSWIHGSAAGAAASAAAAAAAAAVCIYRVPIGERETPFL